MTDPQSDKPRRICVFLLQMGGPQSLADVEPFLRNLFEDVLPLPRLIRRPLARIIARRRAPEVIPLYQLIGNGSPLRANTQAQAEALKKRLEELGLEAKVLACMRYAPPRAADALEIARSRWNDALWVTLPLYPQYSLSTTASSEAELVGLLTTPEQARLLSVSAYPADERYLDALAECIREGLAAFPDDVRGHVHLLFSAHGLPVRLVRKGDPYPEHVRATIDGVMNRLGTNLPFDVAYQSKVGPVRWLEPATDATVRRLGAQGIKNLLVVPVSFVSEHIETLYELDILVRDIAKAAGIERYVRAPTPGTRPAFIDALARQVVRVTAGQ